MRLHGTATDIAGVHVVERELRSDARGSLSRLFSAAELAALGWRRPVAQVNHSVSRRRGTLRGMHFQHPPHAEMKLVTCLSGVVLDVAVDLRADSPTFLRHVARELSADNLRALLIPEGCAHGFQALTDDVTLLYLHSAAYAPEAEGGVNPHDPRLGISWPMPVTEITARDADRAFLAVDFAGLSR
jgi:dTDP-4-dehydrorhamnose 3,5-epimerase